MLPQELIDCVPRRFQWTVSLAFPFILKPYGDVLPTECFDSSMYVLSRYQSASYFQEYMLEYSSSRGGALADE